MKRYGLRDDQFARIEALLPGRPGTVGRSSRLGNRLFVEAVIWKFRSGAPWRDLPERFGDWKNTHKRFSRWAASGVRAIKAVIPPKSNRRVKRACDFALYAERNLVERFFNAIKHYRGIATRYEKTARNFLAGLHLVCAIAWLK
jgi:transposase